MSKVTFFLLMGLLSFAAAATTTTGTEEVASEAVAAAPETDGDSSNVVESEDSDMDTAATTYISNHAINENHVGQYNTRTCQPLATAVVNLNQCCSVNAGPIDSTNIKKCCLPERKIFVSF